MSGHTPGPWFVKDRLRVAAAIKTPGSGFVAEVHFREDSLEAEANARLIAAAPMLLEALRIAHDWLAVDGCACISDEDGACALCRASAAIAAATGEPKP